MGRAALGRFCGCHGGKQPSSHTRLLIRPWGGILSNPRETPLMQQWWDVKSRYRDALVFFQVGDFFEMFREDAEEGARLLGLTLTTRNNGAARRVPLAGVPAKACEQYVARLAKLGKKVAICEQVGDQTSSKGLVQRKVVEVITPGTVVSDSLLEASRNNFVVSLVGGSEHIGMAALDVSTGELILTPVPSGELGDELARLEPRELLLSESGDGLPGDLGPAVRTVRPDWLFDPAFGREELQRRYRVQSLDGFGFEESDVALVRAAGAVVSYVDEVRPGTGEILRMPRIRRPGTVMALDSMTRRNLELVEPLRPDDGDACLLRVLDRTCTAMGARLLRSWVLEPLVDAARIRRRQDTVVELFERRAARRKLRDALADIRDLDRLGTKIGSGRATPREVLSLGLSLREFPGVVDVGNELEAGAAVSLLGDFDVLADVCELIAGAISENAPAHMADGGVIQTGFNEALDELRTVRRGVLDSIAALEAEERVRTGIASLKVGFHKVFGYYLEVTKANAARVPEHYVRKQTLSNAERYSTARLREWEEEVSRTQGKILAMEQEIFLDVRGQVADSVSRIQSASRRLAALDAMASLAEVAEERGYAAPEVSTDFALEIVGGRHPVVETMMPREEFIPNDLRLAGDSRIVILTGPNMAGKSTVLRQVGLIQLMAQMGSMVPAERARLGVCDRVYTRVGASDNLARGQSTFMVEMHETAAIMHGAGERSLVLLDEIGRGTSTYDGVSIAWAVTEYLHDHVGAKGIFATHYHELTRLGDELQGARNLNVVVRESGDRIVFLRRLAEGGADRSYGIQVARLAGLPPRIIKRAREILDRMEREGAGDRETERATAPPEASSAQLEMPLFRPSGRLLDELDSLDPDRMSPREALEALYTLRAMMEAG